MHVGHTVGIVGESGCGKTTMGRTIIRLYSVTGGDVIFNGMDISKMKPRELRPIRPQIQMIFQDPYSSLSPRLNVGEIIGEAVRQHGIVSKAEYKDYIFHIMEKYRRNPETVRVPTERACVQFRGRSCQNSTAPAAATLRESTPWHMGITAV